jgi:hypothetical protein
MLVSGTLRALRAILAIGGAAGALVGFAASALASDFYIAPVNRETIGLVADGQFNLTVSQSGFLQATYPLGGSTGNIYGASLITGDGAALATIFADRSVGSSSIETASIYDWTITAPSAAAADLFRGTAVSANGSYYLNAIGGASSEVSLTSGTLFEGYVYDGRTAFDRKCGDSDRSGCASESVSIPYSAAVAYRQIDSVTFGGYIALFADARMDSPASGYSGASASIDPTIVIDPAFADANPGFVVNSYLSSVPVTTVSAAPEPATWAMLILGMGLMGAVLGWRRERTLVPA